MKLFAFSDTHGDKATAGLPRFADLEQAVEQMVRAAIDQKVDRVFFLGDLCNPDSQRCHRAIRHAIEVALTLDRHGIASSWLTGNHDVVEDGSGESTLSALVGLRRAGSKARVNVFERPGTEWLSDLVFVVALPYTARSHNYDPAEFVRSLSSATERARLVLVLGHLNVEGAGPGSEVTKFPRGRDVFWPVAAIRERWGARAVMVGGHLHRAQSVGGVRIVGSMLRLAFDEEDNDPGYLEISC